MCKTYIKKFKIKNETINKKQMKEEEGGNIIREGEEEERGRGSRNSYTHLSVTVL